MYTVNNVIESAMTKEGDRLSVLILNEMQDDYIERLSVLDHDFYLANDMYGVPQWNGKSPYENIKVLDRLGSACLSHIDAIVVFNRGGLWERAKSLSDTWHIPLIVVDLTSSSNRVPIPFFTNINIDNTQQLYTRNGNISVGTSENLCNSWQSHYQTFSIPIGIPPKKIETQINAGKILVDKSLPSDYIESLPVKLTEDRFTTDPQQAKIYLHLWNYITPLMVDCMYSGIPVVTFNNNDFIDITNSQACILIDDIRMVGQAKFLEEILSFPMLPTVSKNAQDFAGKNKLEDFKRLWQSVFDYTINGTYLRGIS